MATHTLHTSIRLGRWTALVAGVLAVILVPFLLFEAPLAAWADALMQGNPAWVIAGVLLALLALDVVLPVPSSLVSVGAGALLGGAAGLGVIWLGMTASCLLGYAMGASAGRSAAHRLIGERDLRRLETAFARYGDGMIVVMRALPVLAEASVIFAGISRFDRRAFVIRVAGANAGIALVYAVAGALAGRDGIMLLLAFGAACGLPLVLHGAYRRWGARPAQMVPEAGRQNGRES